MKISGSQIIVKFLEEYGIKTVAGIPGGSILPLYDELNRSSIKHVLVRQEQAAGFIAQGIARSTGEVGVCLATSGPGAMNLFTSIADARSDSIPIVAITGQVNTSLLGTDAFQEADTFGLSFPITKHSIMIKNAIELFQALPLAFYIAKSGRPGPVLIDVPRDIQLNQIEIEDSQWTTFIKNIKNKSLIAQNKDSSVKFHTSKEQIEEKLKQTKNLLSSCKKAVLFLGGGCNSFEQSLAINNLLKEFSIPVVTTLMALGVVPCSSLEFIGMVGMHGSYAANYCMNQADLVFALGVRFDDRATGLVNEFCPNAKIIHIDIDAAEIDKILPTSVSFVSKVESIVPLITQLIKENKIKPDSSWLKKINQIKQKTNSLELGRIKSSLPNPRQIISKIPEYANECGISKENLIVTTDVGQHQMWAAQYFSVEQPRTFLTSGSLGTMGFGLPSAIGASIAFPKKRVVCFSGDGSIMMNIQELATLAELNLPVTVIVFENGTLGMVYQQQKYLFNKNYSASVFSKQPNLLNIAQGFGIEVIDADTDDLWYKKAFDTNRKNKPCLVRISIDSEETVLPFVPGGKPNIEAIK